MGDRLSNPDKFGQRGPLGLGVVVDDGWEVV